MKRLIFFSILFALFCSSAFSLNIWLTLDKSQEQPMMKIMHQFLPDAKVRVFYWDGGLEQMSKLIRKDQAPMSC